MKQKFTETIEILVTIDQNYVHPLEVMLYSLKLNNPDSEFCVWLLYINLEARTLKQLEIFSKKIGIELRPLTINKKIDFSKSLLNFNDYPQEMYFRLLAGQILPASLHRIIYLDPDILVINSIKPLWHINLNKKIFAAAVHEGLTDIMSSINSIRLGTKNSYFNSGVMVMDLDKMREKISLSAISSTIKKYHNILILPDQDILNYLYGQNILKIPEINWNYDARAYSVYLAKSAGKINTEWVIANTSILHFCGKPKPWQKENHTHFKVLYLNYQQMVKRILANQNNYKI